MTEQPTRNAVVLCVDATYLLPCAFMVDQFAADPAANYDVVVVHRGLDDATADALRARAKRPIQTVAFRDDRAGRLQDPAAGYISHATYLRLYLDEVVPPQYERLLYLDTDMYLERHDIARLFELDLGGAVLAAVEDATLLMELVRPDLLPDIPRAWRGPEGIRRYRTGLGLDENAPYFNSGTMLIDRQAWRALGVRERTLDFLESNPERCLIADQSALNAVVAGRWLELSPRYNFQPILGQAGLAPLFAPAILHFCGPQKPWNSDSWPADISDDYRSWLASSDWPGPYPGITGPLPWAGSEAPPKKRARRSWLARLRRRLGGDAPGPRRRAQAVFAAALLAGIGEPGFVDYDEGARRAYRDALARA